MSGCLRGKVGRGCSVKQQKRAREEAREGDRWREREREGVGSGQGEAEWEQAWGEGSTDQLLGLGRANLEQWDLLGLRTPQREEEIDGIAMCPLLSNADGGAVENGKLELIRVTVDAEHATSTVSDLHG